MAKTLDALLARKMELEQEINRREIEENMRLEARNTVEKVMRDHGYTLAELFPDMIRRPSRVRTTVKAGGLYQDPTNAENTWGGRGRMPTWLTEKIANGAKIEDFQVAN